MQTGSRIIWQVILLFLVLGVLAGLFAGYKRISVESHNRGVEVGLEWDEVSRLAQVSQTPVDTVLTRFMQHGVTSIIYNEDVLSLLEQNGQLHASRIVCCNPTDTRQFTPYTYVNLDGPATLRRVRDALTIHGIPIVPIPANTIPKAMTVFDAADGVRITPSTDKTLRMPEGKNPTLISTVDGSITSDQAFGVNWDYGNLRNIGLGLSTENVARAQQAGLAVVGRVGNFPGITPTAARAILLRLKEAGAHLVIFSGDEVLGYRGLEKTVAAMLRDPKSPEPLPPPSKRNEDETSTPVDPALLEPTGLAFGEVEFTKQKGDESMGSALHGDFIRVHSIQTAELALMDDRDVIDRFVRAARERNIRFCYVRLMTTANKNVGTDRALENSLDYMSKITHGIAKGNALVGGGYRFKVASRFADTGPSGSMKIVYMVLALGTAGGAVWMLRGICPLPDSAQRLWLALFTLAFVGMVAVGGESGRKLVALVAGIVFPTVACLKTYPMVLVSGEERRLAVLPSLIHAFQTIASASAITAIGIIHVIGLLATRPFMVRANQFLGIKAQHAVPLIIVVFIALIDGVPSPGETWAKFKARVHARLQMAYQEPARFGTLLVGMIALAAFGIIVARTGNDSGVGASGFELKMRNLMDRVLVVRPRTKEFLVGHPAFVLAIAWWWRGRRRMAIPAFLIGSIGQVSLLNTFCHIHTPVIISVWRDIIGLVLGALIGGAAFIALEAMLPAPGKTQADAGRALSFAGESDDSERSAENGPERGSIE